MTRMTDDITVRVRNPRRQAVSERGMLTKRALDLLQAIGCEGEIATSLANPPVMGLARQGLVRFRYRSEDLSIIEITSAGRAAIKDSQP